MHTDSGRPILALVLLGLSACLPTQGPARQSEAASEPLARGEALPSSEAPTLDEQLAALVVDGSLPAHERALVVLAGLDDADPARVGPALAEQLARLAAAPTLDMIAGHEGELRVELCTRLGELREPSAFDPLLALLRMPEAQQPKPVYRAAAHALGRLGDARATPALIAVQFEIADVPSTESIHEVAVRAIGAFGELAVPHLIDLLEGRNAAVERRALELGVDASVVRNSAVRMLGVVGSPTASAALVNAMPKADCEAKRKGDPEPWDIERRAFVAHALGFVGDPAAVPALCGCRDASRNPIELYEITAALGRIGGPEAFRCLTEIVARSSYDPDAVSGPEFELEIRWEAYRWLILAASPDRAKAIDALFTKSESQVREEIDRRGYRSGVALLDTCKTDAACYAQVLGDPQRSWFEREVAAFQVARAADPGDLSAAAELAAAFDTPDPDARVNIAWLTAKVAQRTPCPACVEALERVMTAEARSKDASMQAAWLIARQTLAKLGG
jgi:HEAT repeat protein